MKRRTRRIHAAALAIVGSATVTALLVTPAQAQAPDVASWWNAANVGNGAPAPPVPPDVASGDLLIQGSNANGSAPTTPIGGAPVTSQAVAGLIFELPDGATVGPLTLKIDGTAPPSVSVVACKATQTFAAADNGAWGDVTPSDCSQTSAAKLSSDGASLVFDDVSKLVSNSRLAITLLPGALDRVVLKSPDDGALTVTSSSGALGGSPPPPLGSGAAGGSSSGFASQPQAPVGGTAVLPDAGSGAAQPIAPPVVAPSAPAATTPATQPVASSARSTGTGGLSTTQRRVLAGFVIALELLGFLLLMGDRDVERLALGPVAAAGAGAAYGAVGGRLRPPDRGRQLPATVSSVGGVGRFRSERQGNPPKL